jgi:hypothetical protein
MGALYLAAPSDSCRKARANDSVQTARDSAVLDRIFANWKARHDRVHSMHFRWDCRETRKKGTFDPSTRGRTRRVRLDHDQEFDQFGVQLWIDSDERMCSVYTPKFKVPTTKLTDPGRVVGRWMSDGKTDWQLITGWLWETGASQPPVRNGAVSPHQTARMPDLMLQSLLLTFRPQQSSVSWQRDQCQLVSEHAIIDGGHYVKIQRVFEPTRANKFRRVETCWVDPARDDVIVHWENRDPYGAINGAITYQRDKTCGWVPSQWTVEFPGNLQNYKVTKYTINESIDPGTFSHEFPAGTPVSDTTIPGCYVVQSGGSKKTISTEEFHRLRLSPVQPKAQVPTKSGTK